MEWIAGGRGTGRTNMLLLEFMKDPMHSLVVCPNQQQALHVRLTLRRSRSLSKDPMHPSNDPRGRRDWAKWAEKNIISVDAVPMMHRARSFRVLVDNWDYLSRFHQNDIIRYCRNLSVATVEKRY